MFKFTKQHFAAFVISVCALTANPAFASDLDSANTLKLLEQRLTFLEQNERDCGPILVYEVAFNNSKNFVTVLPGEEINAYMHFEIKSKEQEFLKKNHLIVGLKGIGAEVCCDHNYGALNRGKKAKFKLLAPSEPGIYPVRVMTHTGKTCLDAINAWNVSGEAPTSANTIGYIRVVNP